MASTATRATGSARGFTALPAGTVSGDVVGVASLALPMALSGHSQVVSAERMPPVALGFVGHGVNTMQNLVESVLGVSPVPDVRRDVIRLIAVDMASNKTFRPRSVKCQSYEVVDFEAVLASVVSVNGDVRVPIVVGLGLEDSAFGAGSWDRPDVATCDSSIVSEASDFCLSAIHDDDYTEGAVA